MGEPGAHAKPDGPLSTTPFLLIGGLGGVLPTISRLAAYYANHPNPELPGAGLCLGLFLFFVMGALVTLALADRTLRQALIVGISAPALISSVNSGVAEARDTTPLTRPGGRIVDPGTGNPVQPTSWLPNLSTPAYAEGLSKGLPVESYFGRRQVDIQVSYKADESSAPPVQIQFFDEGGYAVGSPVLLSIASQSSSTAFLQTAPVQARGFLVTSVDKRRSILLPSDSFDEAQYRIEVSAQAPSDLKWALGSRRDVSVEALDVERLHVTDAAARLSETIEAEGHRFALGVELSHFQKTVDWAPLADTGLRFAVMRASYGSKPDGKVDEFWSSYSAWPERERVAIGFYHYFRFEQDPAEQAATFLDKVQGRRAARNLPSAVALFENKYDPPVDSPAARDRYFSQVRQFLVVVDAALPTRTLLFLPAESVSGLPPDLAQRQLWVKDLGLPRPRLPSEGVTYSLWTFGIGRVAGIGTPVALSIFNGDLDAYGQFARRDQ